MPSQPQVNALPPFVARSEPAAERAPLKSEKDQDFRRLLNDSNRAAESEHARERLDSSRKGESRSRAAREDESPRRDSHERYDSHDKSPLQAERRSNGRDGAGSDNDDSSSLAAKLGEKLNRTSDGTKPKSNEDLIRLDSGDVSGESSTEGQVNLEDLLAELTRLLNDAGKTGAGNAEVGSQDAEKLIDRLQTVLNELDGENAGANPLAQLLAQLEAFAKQAGQASAGTSNMTANTNVKTLARLQALTERLSANSGGQAATGEMSNDELMADLKGKTDFAKLLTVTNKGDESITGQRSTDTVSQPKASIQAASGGEQTSGRSPQLQPAERGFVVQPQVKVPVGQPQWSQAVGERVLWLASQNVSSAELRLDPPELGPVQVKVAMNGDQANITFTSQQAGVREALDESAQRLRDMFSEQGLNLGDVDVSDQPDAQEFAGDEQESRGEGAELDPDEELSQRPPQALGVRLVDHYA